MRFLPTVLALAASVGAANAHAQTVEVPLVEIGLDGGVLGFVGDGVYTETAIGPRVSLNVSPRDAIELASSTVFEGRGVYGIYVLQYKRSIWRPSVVHGGTFFATAGVGGYFERQRIPTRQASRPDGSVVVFPAHATGELSGFELATVGMGVEQWLSRHAAVSPFRSGATVRTRALTPLFPVGCVVLLAACELVPPDARIVPGPTVPSPLALSAPYEWDTADQLAVWADNQVSRGALSIDSNGSNGAIAIQFAGADARAPQVVLRGPDLDPAAKGVRTVRLRYQWSPALGSASLPVTARVDPTTSSATGLQPSTSGNLKAGEGWSDFEFQPFRTLTGTSTGVLSPDVRYLYLTMPDVVAGMVRIDSISLVQ